MHRHMKTLGRAKSIRVRTAFFGYSHAWDCRPFGFGRVVAPVATGSIEIAPHVELDLATGELRADPASQKRLAS